MLIEAQAACDEQARHVDVVCFTKAAHPAELHADESSSNRAVRPVALETDAENNEEDVHSNASEEDNILNDSEAPEDAYADAHHADTDSAVRPADLHADEIDTDSAVRPGASQAVADIHNDSETLDAGAMAEPFEEDLDISALEATTSAHDDWLHRGPFLFDMDFHTYIRYTVRKPRPKDLKISDADRAEHVFLFDSHYALAASHWQQLVTDGLAKLVVMEALKCPSPSLNNGEDNAVFKSLIGTLIKCPGPGHCADPLFCKPGFFQVTVPESSTQPPASELPDWIDHERFTRRRCPLRISRRTHADNAPSTFSCRLQWKARRAEIEVLAKQAADLSDDAKRIPVVADTTLVRAFHSRSAAPLLDPSSAVLGPPHSGSAAQPVQSQPTWRFMLCFTQMWMTKSGQALPPFARTVLEYIGKTIHHQHQMSLAQFSAYHLRDIIYHLDMLAIARTTKLTATSKEKVEDETLEHVNVSGPAVVTEFYGGEQTEQPEDEDVDAESWRPRFSLGHDRLTAILSRHSEIAAASTVSYTHLTLPTNREV